MAARQAIDLALDLARMPALARTSVPPPIPEDIADLMRVAAGNPQACAHASEATGEPAPVLVEAARFYLQQMLFRPDADCYRILGIDAAAPRAIARSHMRWLLEWLHPDRNSSWDAIYAERVLRAWHEVSAGKPASAVATRRTRSSGRHRSGSAAFRLPWIAQPAIRRQRRRYARILAVCVVPTGLLIIVIALWSAFYHFGGGQSSAMTP